MEKDKRTVIIKTLFNAGEIKTFHEIFDFVPKNSVYEYLGFGYRSFERLLAAPDLFTLRDLNALATFFEVDPLKFIELVHNTVQQKKKPRKKS